MMLGRLERDVLLNLAPEDEQGCDRASLAVGTGFTPAQVSDALQRLRSKGLVSSPGRWHETSVWWLSSAGDLVREQEETSA